MGGPAPRGGVTGAAPGAGPAAAHDPWERHAGWWQAHFTAGADPEYTEQIEPLVDAWLPPGDAVADLGCGEGQLARRLAEAGWRSVVGVDAAAAQLRTARRRGGGPRYVRATLGALPFRPATFDAVLVCLVFEHVTTLGEVVGEIARVLRPGGRFVLLLNHPLLQAPGSGWVDDHILGEQYWRVGGYLGEQVVQEEVAPGVRLPFVHRPLSVYLNTLAEAGLWIEQMAEPPPPPGFRARAPEYEAAAEFPRLLALRLARR